MIQKCRTAKFLVLTLCSWHIEAPSQKLFIVFKKKTIFMWETISIDMKLCVIQLISPTLCIIIIIIALSISWDWPNAFYQAKIICSIFLKLGSKRNKQIIINIKKVHRQYRLDGQIISEFYLKTCGRRVRRDPSLIYSDVIKAMFEQVLHL